MKNNATVRIVDADGNKVFSVNYADLENWEEADKTMSCSATYQEGWQTYQVSADISLVAVSQSYEILLKLIPLIAVVILLISVLAALVCSRYFSKPLIHICSVAKRMTSLDMTWKCEVRQRDEIVSVSRRQTSNFRWILSGSGNRRGSGLTSLPLFPTN